MATMTSSMYALARMPESVASIHLWKWAGALHRPKGSLTYSNLPQWAIKAVLGIVEGVS